MGALTWWLSPHPDWEEGEDWPELVPVVQYETDSEIVLIDPFLPAEGSFDQGDKPVTVLLTQRSHYRGTGDFVARYGAAVWEPGTEWVLPRGVEVLELDGQPQQVVIFVPEHATLISGDVLTGRDGVMHVFVDDADRDRLLAWRGRGAQRPRQGGLGPPAEETVIVPHCEEPVFLDGSARIRAAVAEARSAR